ncbi:MFS transporter [Sphingobium sufflavum]|uniref:MFS transporter n=1 Tax=Sphingobium sufflavum TaxID=1129547 RepID=UPI001F3C3616|nr:MFS transporter [Sphingobium sufflavum]MCE7796261.1 MFS transporter [Sphingobium sufflavum]
MRQSDPIIAPCAPAAPRSAMPGSITMLSVAGGFVAANGHFSQPLLPVMAHSFGVTPAMMGALPAITQFGLAVGLLTVIPLYDMFERRRAIVAVLLLLAAAGMAHALSSSLGMLWTSAFFVGLGCCAAQLMTPYAALLALPGREGEASSRVLSGVLAGVLLSRIVAGVVEPLVGWRSLYAASALCILIVAVIVARHGVASRNEHAIGYRPLMASLLHMAATMPRLRRHAINGALTFGALMVFWGTYATHVRVAYGFGPLETGLIGVVGVAGAVAATFAGRLVDGGRFRQTQIAAALLMMAGYVLMALPHGDVLLLCAGVLLIDLAGGLSHAANQSSAMRLAPEARGRINSIYMVAYFLGGSISVSVGSLLYLLAGWAAICLYGGALALILFMLEYASPVGSSDDRG